MNAPKRRAVIVAGNRTPFVRAFQEYLPYDAIALSGFAVQGLLDRTGLDKREVQSIVWGGVILPNGAPTSAVRSRSTSAFRPKPKR